MTRHRRASPSPVPPAQGLPLWAAICFLVSGAAGLVYEVVWSKQISYVLGNSLHAVSTVVAAFLTGLACGAYLVGVRIARRRGGARAYALLELGVGVLGLLSMPVLAGLDPVVGALYRALGGETALFGIARLALLFLLLVPPAALMGATLPVLVGHFEHRSVGPALARLYAINTAGAVLGSALAGFVLMPGIGLVASTWVAAALNLLASALAWSSARRVPAPPSPAEKTAAPTSPGEERTATPGSRRAAPARGAEEAVPQPLLPPGPRLTLAVLFALSGFGALAFQIAWVRLFGLILGSSVYSFSAVLAVYLTGLAAGSALVAPWLRGAGGRRDPARLLALFGGLQLGLALVTLATVWLFPLLPEMMYQLVRATTVRWGRLYAGELGLVALVLLLPCLGFGALFPVATRLLQSRDGGHATGLGYAVNTAGTLAGSLLAGFLLIPRLGVQGTHIAAALLAGAVGLAALGLATAGGPGRARPLSAAVGAVAVAIILLASAPAWDPALMSAGVYRPLWAIRLSHVRYAGRDAVHSSARSERVLFYREGLNSSVFVGSDPRRDEVFLKVGGKTDASSGDMLTQVLLGLVPGAMARPGARAAVVGLGSGASLAAALAAGVGPVDVMEIEPAVVTASHFFDEPGHAPLADPRVHLILGDARTHLYNTRGTYDVIISEPSNPWLAGVNNLFTVDFYRRLRARLAPGGVFCQWIQLYELAPGTLSSLLTSFLEVFPSGQAFHVPVGMDLLLVAAPDSAGLPLARLRAPELAFQLRRARLLAPESVAAWYACPFDSLRAALPPAPLNRDDRPVVEFQAPRDLYRISWITTAGVPPVRIPRVNWAAARRMFPDWAPGDWYLARARQWIAIGLEGEALAGARAAMAEGMPSVAQEIVGLVGEKRRLAALTHAQKTAIAAARAGRPAEARDTLLAAIGLAPGNGLTWLLLADAEQALGRRPEALAAVARAWALGDSSVRADARALQAWIERRRPAAPAPPAGAP